MSSHLNEFSLPLLSYLGLSRQFIFTSYFMKKSFKLLSTAGGEVNFDEFSRPEGLVAFNNLELIEAQDKIK